MFNPFPANILILYSLLTPENFRFSGVFSKYKMETVSRNELILSIALSTKSLSFGDRSFSTYVKLSKKQTSLTADTHMYVIFSENFENVRNE